MLPYLCFYNHAIVHYISTIILSWENFMELLHTCRCHALPGHDVGRVHWRPKHLYNYGWYFFLFVCLFLLLLELHSNCVQCVHHHPRDLLAPDPRVYTRKKKLFTYNYDVTKNWKCVYCFTVQKIWNNKDNTVVNLTLKHVLFNLREAKWEAEKNHESLDSGTVANTPK